MASVDIESLAGYLSRFGISKITIKQLLERTSVVDLEPGGNLIEIGNSKSLIGFMIDGFVRMYSIDDEGREWVRYLAGPGQFVASMSTFTDSRPSEEAISCITNCKIVLIDRQSFDEMFNRRDFEINVQRIAIAILLDIARERSDLLHLRATDRYRYFTKKYPRFENHIPLQYIASYLGITPQSFSRIRKGRP